MTRKVCHYAVVIFISFLAMLSLAPKASTEVNDDYALKISLENQLEKKLKQVIVEITGTDKVVIFVNAELISKGGDRGKIEKKADALVLPGVPAKKEFGTGQSSELMLPGTGKYSVSKIVLSIWIDNSVPGSIVDLIQDIAKNVIGFSQTRGDQINVKKVDFESKGFFRTFFAYPNILWLILTIVGGFMMVSTGIFLMDPLKKIIPALKDVDWNRIRGSAPEVSSSERMLISERETVTASSQSLTPQSAQDSSIPFSFIREKDISALAFLLKDSSAQDIAVVANYLDPSLAMSLLEQIPEEKFIEVAIVLGKEDVNVEKVNSLEEMVKSKLTYVIGGENMLINLLDMSGEGIRAKIVNALSAKDARAATRIKQRFKNFETILQELSAAGIQSLYRSINASLFAQVLKSTDPAVQQKVINSLSAGAAERLKEEMQLSRPLTAVRLRKERQNIMVILRRLINEGLVEVENS